MSSSEAEGGILSWCSGISLNYHNIIAHSAISIVFLCYLIGIVHTDIKHQFVFYERDPDLSFPYVTSQVPFWADVLLAVIIPFLACIGYVLIQTKVTTKSKRIDVLLLLVFGLTESLLLTNAVTENVKVYVGKPRPNFFALCNYKGFADALQYNNYTDYFSVTSTHALGNINNCLGSIDDIKNAQSSFPSGHTSTIFAGIVYMVLLMKFSVKRIYIDAFPKDWIPFVNPIIKVIGNFFCILPLYLPVWVAITRIQDYHHRLEDIIGGCIIGVTIAYFFWNIVLTQIRETELPIQPTTGPPQMTRQESRRKVSAALNAAQHNMRENSGSHNSVNGIGISAL